MIVDYTTLSTFTTCPMKYKLFILDGLAPKEKPTSLSFGGAIHSALSCWFATNDVEKSIQTFKENYQERENDTLRTIPTGERLLREYFETYKEEPFKIIYNERSFVAELGKFRREDYAIEKWEPINYAGRFDGIILWGKSVYVLEHKTTTRLTYGYFRQFELNLQMDGYVYLCKALVGRCDGVIVDVLAVNRSNEKERQARKTSNYYRNIVNRTPQQLESFRKDVIRQVKAMHHAAAYNSFYQNKSWCNIYGTCPYRDICVNNFDERIIRTRYRRVKWNPLLGQEEEIKEEEQE